MIRTTLLNIPVKFGLVLAAELLLALYSYGAPPEARTLAIVPRVVLSCELTGPADGVVDRLQVAAVGLLGQTTTESFILAGTAAFYDDAVGKADAAPAWVKDHPGCRYVSVFEVVRFYSAPKAAAFAAACPCGHDCPCQQTGECSCYGCKCPDCPGRKGDAWGTDYNAAKLESQRTGKPLLVLLTRDACPHCDRIKLSLADPVVAPLLAGYVPVVCHANNYPTAAKTFGAGSFPALVVGPPTGPAVRHDGYKTPAELAGLLRPAVPACPTCPK